MIKEQHEELIEVLKSIKKSIGWISFWLFQLWLLFIIHPAFFK